MAGMRGWDRQRFPAGHVDHGQHPEFVTIAELIMDEVQAPCLVRPTGFAKCRPMNDHLAPARLFGAQCLAFLAILPVSP